MSPHEGEVEVWKSSDHAIFYCCGLVGLWPGSIGASRFYTLKTFWLTKHLRYQSLHLAIGLYVNVTIRVSIK